MATSRHYNVSITVTQFIYTNLIISKIYQTVKTKGLRNISFSICNIEYSLKYFLIKKDSQILSFTVKTSFYRKSYKTIPAHFQLMDRNILI